METTPILPAEVEAWDALVKALRLLRFMRGEERSERARRLAVVISDLEPLMSTYNCLVMQGRDFVKEADEMTSN